MFIPMHEEIILFYFSCIFIFQQSVAEFSLNLREGFVLQILSTSGTVNFGDPGKETKYIFNCDMDIGGYQEQIRCRFLSIFHRPVC